MAQEREELLGSSRGKGFFSLLWRYLFFGVVVALVALYVGLLLFGTNSVQVLLELKAQMRSLERSIEFLKRENARLQKEYFELKELESEE